MDKKEYDILKKMIEEKYKYHNIIKVFLVVFICLTVFFATLYFANGDLFKSTNIENSVEIVNNGDSNVNNTTILN